MHKAKFVIFSAFILIIFSCQKSTDIKLDFSKQEKEWLKEHKQITLAVDDTYPPLNFVDASGKLTGINIELILLIEERIGIDIKLEGSNWNEALKKAMNHEVDGIINAFPLEERKSKLNFTTQFFKDPMALACHKKDHHIEKFDDLKNRLVAAKKGSRHFKILESRLENNQLVEINTLMDGLDLLSQEKIAGVFDDLAPLYHLISTSSFNNIKIAFIERDKGGAALGIRNDDEVLLSILNKAIQSITDKERLSIQNKWFQFKPEQNLTIFYIAIGVLAIILLIVGLWSWSLNTIVKNKTSELSEALLKAEESDKLKSAFLANISHEIRTPLNGILGFSELLKFPNIGDEERANFIKIIEQSGNRLLNIITDIVNISRIESGQIDLNYSTFNLNEELNNIFTFHNTEIENKSIELKLSIPNNNESQINTDKGKIIQTINILLNNAIKFTDKGFIEFGYTNKQHSVEFYVKDTGKGIHKNSLTKIFERFRQDDTALNNPVEGAGLGLAIAKAFIEALGGEIWVNSEVGKGSTFYFTIPKK